MNNFISDISGKEYPESERITGKIIRKSILNLIRKEHPRFTAEQSISLDEFNRYRERYVSEFLVKQIGDLTNLEKTVVSAITGETTLTDKIETDDVVNLTFGQKVADKVATFGGSWTFIISFGIFLFIWIAANIVFLANKGFDPYPFILLNLILSCIAALQAPVIMMSQNRQEEKDRERSKKDYMVNLKSEVEIRMLHEKIDHLIIRQQQDLIDIQKIQIQMMNDILKHVGKK